MSSMPMSTRLFRLIRGSGHHDPMYKSMRMINFSWVSVVAAILITMMGIYSIDVSEQLRPDGSTALAAVASKQVVFLIIGMLACVLIALPHYRVIGYFSVILFVLCVLLLVFLLIPGVPSWLVRPRNGARAWINLRLMDFQPSELTKIGFVLVIAWYMRFRSHHREMKGLVVPGIIAAIPVALITVQPDLGTASLFVPALFAMLIAAGAKLKHLILIVVFAAMAAPAAYPFMKPHQKQRIVAMVKQYQGDESTSFDINYQSDRAQTLIGAGMVTGMNDDAARAVVHYNQLPEAHNDMIFAVVVSRFGLLGGLAVMALYGLWVGGALCVAASCREPLGRLIAVGLAAFIMAQVVINIGMNLGLVPIIGITLPFMSYGGSSLLTCWLMTGLIVNVALHRPRPPYRSSFEFDDDEPDLMQPTRAYGRKIGFSGRALTR